MCSYSRKEQIVEKTLWMNYPRTLFLTFLRSRKLIAFQSENSIHVRACILHPRTPLNYFFNYFTIIGYHNNIFPPPRLRAQIIAFHSYRFRLGNLAVDFLIISGSHAVCKCNLIYFRIFTSQLILSLFWSES